MYIMYIIMYTLLLLYSDPGKDRFFPGWWVGTRSPCFKLKFKKVSFEVEKVSFYPRGPAGL